MKKREVRARMTAAKAAIRRRPAAAAILAAAAVLATILAVLFAGDGRVFSGIFKDDSGLAMVREGDPSVLHKKGDRRRTLRVYAGDVTGVTNPAYAAAEGDRIVSSIIFEPLMKKGADGRLEPVLAKHFTVSEDGTTYKIQLRKNVRFSDGTALTAEDAVFSIAAMCAVGQPEAGPYANIQGADIYREGSDGVPEGIRALDDLNLEVVFAVPSPDNLEIMETRIQKQAERRQDSFLTALMQLSMGGTGTGAYMQARWDGGTGIRLEENPNYRSKIRDIKTVEFVSYGTYEIGDAVREQAVDVAVFTGDSSLFQKFLDGPQYTLYEKPLPALYYMAMNRNDGRLYIPAVRRAVALSMERQRITDGPLSAYLVKAEGFSPEDSVFAGGWSLAVNQEEAKSLIAQVRELHGLAKEELHLPVLQGNKIQEELAKGIKRDLKDIGFNVDIEVMDQAEYLQKVYMLQDFDLILSGVGSWDRTSSWAGLATDLQGLPTACNSRDLNAAVEELGNAYSERAVETALKELNRVCCEQVPVVPLARPKQFVAVSADLSGFRITRYDDFLQNIHEIRVR